MHVKLLANIEDSLLIMRTAKGLVVSIDIF